MLSKALDGITGKGYNGSAVDVWSLGVILYEMLMGEVPFKGSNQASLFKSIVKGAYTPLPTTFSANCRDLLTKMLVGNFEKRISIGDLARHPWITQGASAGLLMAENELSGRAAGDAATSEFRSLSLVLPGMALNSAEGAGPAKTSTSEQQQATKEAAGVTF